MTLFVSQDDNVKEGSIFLGIKKKFRSDLKPHKIVGRMNLIDQKVLEIFCMISFGFKPTYWSPKYVFKAKVKTQMRLFFSL